MALKTGNVVQCKSGTVARSNTSNKFLFTLPANAMPIRVSVNGVVSDSATSATIGVYNIPMGETTAAAIATADVKASAQAVGVLEGIALTRQSVPQQVYGIYSENGAANTGGPWTILVEYL